MQEMRKTGLSQSLGPEDSLEEGMATHSSILAWTIPWTQEPGGLQVLGLQRVRHTEETAQHSERNSSYSQLSFASKNMLLYL